MDFFKSFSFSPKSSSPQPPPLDAATSRSLTHRVFRFPARAMDGRYPAAAPGPSAGAGPKRPTSLESRANGHLPAERSHHADAKGPRLEATATTGLNGFRRPYANALVQKGPHSEEENSDDGTKNGSGKRGSSFQLASFLDIFRREKRSSNSTSSDAHSSDGRSQTFHELSSQVERNALVNYGLVSSPPTPATTHPHQLSSLARTDVFILDAYAFISYSILINKPLAEWEEEVGGSTVFSSLSLFHSEELTF